VTHIYRAQEKNNLIKYDSPIASIVVTVIHELLEWIDLSVKYLLLMITYYFKGWRYEATDFP